MKLKNAIPSLAAALLAVAPIANAQNATTDPVGFSQIQPPSGTSTIVPGFVKGASFSGLTTVTGQTFSGNFSSSLNPTSFSDRPNYPTHYVQVTSGEYSGYVFDVESVNQNGAIVSDGVPSQLNGASVQIVVRPHVTLNDLSSNSSGLSDYSDAATFFNPDGSTSVFYPAEGSWVADDFSTPSGHKVIYPGTGFTFTASSPSVVFTTTGNVQTVSTVVPIYAGATNIVGPLNPSNDVTIQNLNIASSLSPYSDAINVFSTSGNMATLATYYSDGTEILDGSFSPLPPNSPDNNPINSGFSVTASSSFNWVSPSPMN